jgi:hypothetical protein
MQMFFEFISHFINSCFFFIFLCKYDTDYSCTPVSNIMKSLLYAFCNSDYALIFAVYIIKQADIVFYTKAACFRSKIFLLLPLFRTGILRPVVCPMW